jgi:acetoacetate decarboxylase
MEVAGAAPLVTFSRMSYTDVDYLAGGGYNELTVGIAATVDDADGEVAGSYLPVVWVDQPVPLQIGREVLGYAKVHGELPATESSAGHTEFEVRERGAVLLRGSARNLTPLAADRLTSLRRAAAEVTVLGWKYIPGLDGVADADYPTRIPLHFDWSEATSGDASLTFESPTWVAAPVASRVVQALAHLPVLSPLRALVAAGSGSIDRRAARRLHLRGRADRDAQ